MFQMLTIDTGKTNGISKELAYLSQLLGSWVVKNFRMKYPYQYNKNNHYDKYFINTQNQL